MATTEHDRIEGKVIEEWQVQLAVDRGDAPPSMDEGEPSGDESQIIAEVGGETEVVLLNLTEFTEPTTVDDTISREASFDNKVYFYQVDDLTGMVNGVVVRNHGYSQAVVD